MKYCFSEIFTSFTDPRSIIMFTNRSMVTATFQFRNEVSYSQISCIVVVIMPYEYYLSQGTGVEAALYFLTLTNIDETEKLNSAKTFTLNANNTNLSVVQSLPYRRLWNYQVLALNCSEHPVTSLLELSKSS